MKSLLALPLLLALGGCVTTGEGSVKGGECKVFEAPMFAVRGARLYDQDWIDSNIEGGIGACKWRRPAARPPELDAGPLQPRAAPKKRSFAARIKAKVWRAHSGIWPTKKLTPVVNVPEAPHAAPKRSAIDELLHPNEAQ